MLFYIILGILQGIFEWIPISSEGVVALASQFLGVEMNPMDVALFLHLGTAFSAMVYFRKDWSEVLRGKNPELVRFFLISATVSLLVGYPVYMFLKSMAVGNGLLAIMGCGLLFTAYFHKAKRAFLLGFEKLAIIVGFLQGLAVVPGLSRSGSTIFGLSLRESSPSEVLKISYMMSVPVILASSFYLFLSNPAFIYEGWPSLISGFLMGLLSLSCLLKLTQRIDFFKFTLIFSTLCFLGSIIGFIT